MFPAPWPRRARCVCQDGLNTTLKITANEAVPRQPGYSSFDGMRSFTTQSYSGWLLTRQGSRSRPASRRSASRPTSTGPSAARATATSGCTRTASCSSARPRRAILATAACRASAPPWSTSRPATTSSSSPPDLRLDQERPGRRAHLVRHPGAGVTGGYLQGLRPRRSSGTCRKPLASSRGLARRPRSACLSPSLHSGYVIRDYWTAALRNPSRSSRPRLTNFDDSPHGAFFRENGRARKRETELLSWPAQRAITAWPARAGSTTLLPL